MTWTKHIGVGGVIAGAALAVAAAVHAQQRAARDYGKSLIERPAEAVLAANTGAWGNSTTLPEAGPAFTNPRVQPGKVRWHKDFAAACAAATRSGKPVLLFHLMGRLDDRFC
jgi:hypothetical protein